MLRNPKMRRPVQSAISKQQQRPADIRKRSTPFSSEQYFLSSVMNENHSKWMEKINKLSSNGKRTKRKIAISSDQSYSPIEYENNYYMNDDESVDPVDNRPSIISFVDAGISMAPSTPPSTSSSIGKESTEHHSTLAHEPTIKMATFNEKMTDGTNDEDDLFEGFCIDVLRLIAKMVGFEYSIKLVPDGKYGVYDLETGEWNGIVRELMDKVSFGFSIPCCEWLR